MERMEMQRPKVATVTAMEELQSMATVVIVSQEEEIPSAKQLQATPFQLLVQETLREANPKTEMVVMVLHLEAVLWRSLKMIPQLRQLEATEQAAEDQAIKA